MLAIAFILLIFGLFFGGMITYFLICPKSQEECEKCPSCPECPIEEKIEEIVDEQVPDTGFTAQGNLVDNNGNQGDGNEDLGNGDQAQAEGIAAKTASPDQAPETAVKVPEPVNIDTNFAYFDKNNDEKISFQEYRGTSGNNPSVAANLKRIFDQMDTNKDSHLSKAEMQTFYGNLRK